MTQSSWLTTVGPSNDALVGVSLRKATTEGVLLFCFSLVEGMRRCECCSWGSPLIGRPLPLAPRAVRSAAWSSKRRLTWRATWGWYTGDSIRTFVRSAERERRRRRTSLVTWPRSTIYPRNSSARYAQGSSLTRTAWSHTWEISTVAWLCHKSDVRSRLKENCFYPSKIEGNYLPQISVIFRYVTSQGCYSFKCSVMCFWII